MDTDFIEDDGLTSKRVAKAKLGDISESSFYRLVEAKELEAVKVGSTTKVTTASLKAYIARAPRVVINRHRRAA